MSPSILSEGPSVPLRGSRFVGIDSIKKLTTPGSVGTERVQEDSARTRIREVNEIEDSKEVKEKTARSIRRKVENSGPLFPRLPFLPPFPFFSPCITHLT